MWKVRIVSCVPGSPMDCAAMMPTASPCLAGSLVASVSFNYMVNATCSQSVADIKKNVAKADAQRAEATKAAAVPPRVYSTRE